MARSTGACGTGWNGNSRNGSAAALEAAVAATSVAIAAAVRTRREIVWREIVMTHPIVSCLSGNGAIWFKRMSGILRAFAVIPEKNKGVKLVPDGGRALEGD